MRVLHKNIKDKKREMKILNIKIKYQQEKMRVLLKLSIQIVKNESNPRKNNITYKSLRYYLKILNKNKCHTHPFIWRRKMGHKFNNHN